MRCDTCGKSLDKTSRVGLQGSDYCLECFKEAVKDEGVRIRSAAASMAKLLTPQPPPSE